MKREEFERLVQHAGMAVPEGIEAYLADIDPQPGGPLVSRAFLRRAAERAGVGEIRLQQLTHALEAIEKDPQLLRLALALREDVHRALIHQRACEYERPLPQCLQGFDREAYSLLFALGCLEHGLKQLEARGLPKEDYEEVCWRMADGQLKRFEKTGDPAIGNYSWDMNFYGCGIFFLDRLYFIPFKWGEPTAYRRHSDGKVVALWPEGAKVRQDGQLDGTNGVHDAQAFTTTWEEDDRAVTAYPVNPVGIIRREPVTLLKAEWTAALKEGDMTLAAHIPGGEGYTPQRWKSSMEQAKAFFDRWFSEVETRGFWSESWLYDPSLYRLLPAEGRIMSVQQQFYNYPTSEGESMAKLEVFGGDDVDLAAVEASTSLQVKLRDSLLKGEHYHTSGMFVLHEDLPRFGQRPYQTDQDIRDYHVQTGGQDAADRA